MSDTAKFTGESTDSFEAAARDVAKQLEQGHPDELIEFEIETLSYKQGGIAGLPPTYIVDVVFVDEEQPAV